MGFWGEVRQWVHSQDVVYEPFIELFKNQTDEHLRNQCAQYIADHIGFEICDPQRAYILLTKHLRSQLSARLMYRVDVLNAFPGVEVAIEIGKPVDPTVLAHCRQLGVSETVLELYTELNGYRLRVHQTGSLELHDIYFNDLEWMMGGGHPIVLGASDAFDDYFWSRWAPPLEEGSLNKHAKHVEWMEGVSRNTGLVFNEQGNVDMYLCDDMKMYPLTLSLMQYFERSIAFLGCDMWYYLFVEQPTPWMYNALPVKTLLQLVPESRYLIKTKLIKADKLYLFESLLDDATIV